MAGWFDDLTTANERAWRDAAECGGDTLQRFGRALSAWSRGEEPLASIAVAMLNATAGAIVEGAKTSLRLSQDYYRAAASTVGMDVDLDGRARGRATGSRSSD